MDNFLTYINSIKEGLIKTYDIDFVIDKSIQRLSVLNVGYKIEKKVNNTIKLTIFDFNKVYISHLFGLLNKNFINLFGWFPSYMYITNLSGMLNAMNYDENYLKRTHEYLQEVSIVYESKFDLVIDKPDKLYHISIQEYMNKILTIGLVPKSKSKISSHGDRIYVCNSIENCLNLIEKMKFYFFDKRNINTDWVIYEIDTKGIDITLYNDPNFINKGYYLLGNVPPQNIKIIQKENDKRRIN